MEIRYRTIRHNITLKFKSGYIPIMEIFLGLDRIGAVMVEDLWDCVVECLLKSEPHPDSIPGTGVSRRKEEAEVILQHRIAFNAALEKEGDQEDDIKRVQPDGIGEADEVSDGDEDEEGSILH